MREKKSKLIFLGVLQKQNILLEFFLYHVEKDAAANNLLLWIVLEYN